MCRIRLEDQRIIRRHLDQLRIRKVSHGSVMNDDSTLELTSADRSTTDSDSAETMTPNQESIETQNSNDTAASPEEDVPQSPAREQPAQDTDSTPDLRRSTRERRPPQRFDEQCHSVVVSST